MSKKRTLEDMQLVASKRGGLCLSTSYKGLRHKLEWECHKHHKWYTGASNVVHRHSWCPYCAQRIKKTLQDMKELAIEHGGDIISGQTYVNNKTHLLWKCNQCGTEFSALPQDVQRGHWCPRCASLHINESKCRFIFEYLTGFSFQKNRKIFDNKYELDGYCADLNIAFEYHGEYHYQIIKKHQITRSLEQVQIRKSVV